jgi:hypothetical protein
MAQQYQPKYLHKKRAEIMFAIIEAMISPLHGAPPPASTTTLALVDWALTRLDQDNRKKILVLLKIANLLGFFFGGKTLRHNSLHARRRQLRWMEQNPISLVRLGFFGLRNYISMGYFAQVSVWQAIHYQGPVKAQGYPEPTPQQLSQGRMEVIL